MSNRTKVVLFVTLLCLVACIWGPLLSDGLPIKIAVSEVQSITFYNRRREITFSDRLRLNEIANIINSAEWQTELAPTLRDTTLCIRYKNGSIQSLFLTYPENYPEKMVHYHRRFFSFRSAELDALLKQPVSSEKTEL